jgi:hypothetical protein
VIGKGRGQYSNSGYGLFRLVIPYLLGSDPSLIASGPLDGYPSTNDFNSGPKSQREVLTAVYYFLFVRDHVLKPCGVTKASVFPNDNLCYYNTDGWGTDEFQYCDRDSHLLTCGEGGWHMSAHDLRKFLVGVQQGKPFGGDTSWWWDVMRKHQLGMDPTWLTSAAPKKSRIVLQNGNIVNLFRKSGGSGFNFHSGDGAEARAAAEWIITDDGTTAAIVMNSGSKSHIGVPSLLTVLKDAYKTAADAIERTPARPTRSS